jgi:hypothetical protein
MVNWNRHRCINFKNMKKSIILSAILFGSLVYSTANAQVSVHIGFNIPTRRVYVPAPQPQPVMVYDNDELDDSDDYYYLPDVEAYYSIPTHRYFYMDGGSWVSAAYLPGAYRNYDWRTARRFEVRGRRPYMQHEQYRSKWGGNANRGDWNRRDNNYAGRNTNRNDWNRGNNGNDRPNGGFNQPGRNYGNRGGFNQPSQPNRNDNNGSNWGGGRDRGNQPTQPNQNNNGGGRGNWGGGQDRGNQPSQPNRNDNNGGGRGNWGGGQGSGSQPSQPNRNDNNGGGRGNWGGGQDRGSQPAQPSRNDSNGGGRDRDNQGGGNSQFAQSRGAQGEGSHRQARF